MLPQKSLNRKPHIFIHELKHYESNFKENWFQILIWAALIGPSKFVHVKYVLGSGWVSICAHGERGLNLSTYIHSGADFIQSGAKTFTCLLRTLSRNIWMESFIDRVLMNSPKSRCVLYMCQTPKCIWCSSSIQSVVSLTHFPSGTAPASTKTLTLTPHLQ